MKIPSKMMIAEHEIEIEIHKDSRQLIRSGDYSNWYSLIRICTQEYSESIQAETFLHEIIEAVNGIFGLEVDHPKIVVLSEMLFQTIRRNKLDFINP